MFLTAFTLAFFSTLLICVGIIFLKFVILQVGPAVFALMLIVMTFISLLIVGEKNDE